MRYLIAMVVAAACALAATVFFGSMISSWAVANAHFDSPDEVSNYEDLVFIATGAVGLLIGWLVGWAIGGQVTSDDMPE